jgi:superfamily II DNA or RNA helicase
VYDIDATIKSKCDYFFSCLTNNKSKKCIIYCEDTIELEAMMNGMNLWNKNYNLNYDMNIITSVCNAKLREQILHEFANNDNIQLLFSLRILHECINIPSCDSITK